MKPGEKIKILIVDDSYLVREMLNDILKKDNIIEVIGMASNGKEAVEMADKLKPDVITMDIEMPVMDGLEATEKIMTKSPCPILVVTSLNYESGMGFEMISKGALDIIQKPELKDMQKTSGNLIEQIKLIAGIKVITRMKKSKIKKRDINIKETIIKKNQNPSVVCVASSTGGPGILKTLLSELPVNFLPTIIVQHINEGFNQNLIEWLQKDSKNKIKEAEEGELLKKGIIYLAPKEYHITIDKQKKIQFDDSPPVKWIKPSADILFSSIAEVYAENAIGIILSGMGYDGTQGIKDMKNEGAVTFAQDEDSCVVFGMPKSAIESGSIDYILPPKKIAEKLMEYI